MVLVNMFPCVVLKRGDSLPDGEDVVSSPRGVGAIPYLIGLYAGESTGLVAVLSKLVEILF